jgi:hypothetical protein
MLVPEVSVFTLRYRRLVQGPDRVYEELLRFDGVEGFYELWPLGQQQRGVRIKPLPQGWMNNPTLVERVTELMLARLGLGKGGKILHEQPRLTWRYNAITRQRKVIRNTMPAWWHEPPNAKALCDAWERQTHANPLPLGWGANKEAPQTPPPFVYAAE